jgi:plastocyanin
MRAVTFAVLMGCAAPNPASAQDGRMAHVADGFWAHWGDGRAEMNAYTLVTPRYGELRHGRTVLVFVTEDFTDAQRVKSDGGHEDEYPVLKLNEARDFQTGLYDYNVMSSTFVRIDGRGSFGMPVKVSTSIQEWCGSAYEQFLPRGGEIILHGHSYFDGEADHERRLPIPEGGVAMDALPILVRGLVGEFVAPGASADLPVLPTLLSGRLAHQPVAWATARVTRSAGGATVQVPAGSFVVHEVTVAVEGGQTTTWQVEDAWPHRIVGWSSSDGERAALLGSERMPYWQQNHEGEEALLDRIGLAPPAWPSGGP